MAVAEATMFTRAFLVLWVALFVGTAGIGMVSPLLPIFAEELGATGIWLGLAFSGFAISQLAVTPVVGRLSDRFGRKPFLVAGMSIFCLAAVGYVFSANYQELVAARIFSGLGAALVFPIAFAYIGDLAPHQREGTYMGAFNVAQMLGFGSGPLVGGLLADAGGMDATFMAMVVSTGVASALILGLLPPSTRRKQQLRIDRAAPSTFIGNSTLMAALAYNMAWALGLGALFAFFAVFMRSEIHASGAQIGLVLSARMLLSGFLQPLAGRAADRYHRPSLVAISLSIVALITFFIASAEGFFVILALFLLMGLFDSVAFPAASAMAVEVGRSVGMGTVMGILQMALSLGMIGGSVVGGSIMDGFGIRAVFYYTAATTGAGALAVASLGWRAGRPRPLRLDAASAGGSDSQPRLQS